MTRVAVEPASHVVRIDLLAPHEPGARLAENPQLLRRRSLRRDRGIELVRVLLARRDDAGERIARPVGAVAVWLVQPQPQFGRATRGDCDAVPERPFVPTPSGLTVAAPETTWSLIPSFGYGVVAAAPNTRGAFDSFSQRSGSGNEPSGPGAPSSL